MKARSKGEKTEGLRSEYDLSGMLKEGTQGKYYGRYRGGTNLVLLAPDIARAFPTDEAVNEALRLVIRLRKLPLRKPSTPQSSESV